jgi:hypothetical protein
VEGDHDGRAPAARLEDEAGREARQVTHVHDLRLQFLEDKRPCRRGARVAVRLEARDVTMEVVEGEDPHAVDARLGDVVIRPSRVGRAVQDGDVVVAGEAARKSPRVDLGAPGSFRRVGVVNEEDPQAHSG